MQALRDSTHGGIGEMCLCHLANRPETDRSARHGNAPAIQAIPSHCTLVEEAQGLYLLLTAGRQLGVWQRNDTVHLQLRQRCRMHHGVRGGWLVLCSKWITAAVSRMPRTAHPRRRICQWAQQAQDSAQPMRRQHQVKQHAVSWQEHAHSIPWSHSVVAMDDMGSARRAGRSAEGCDHTAHGSS